MKTFGVELLIVEDDDNDLELIMRSLKSFTLHNKVHVARDGDEALRYVYGSVEAGFESDGHNPMVIMLDLKLPRISGLEVLKKLKSDKRTNKIPIVVLTSSRESSDLKQCYELGVNSYVVKPFELADFIKAVSTAGLYWVVINQPPAL